MTTKNIMDHFPLEKARGSQVEVLKAIQVAFEKGYKNVLLEAPVGSGKSAIAVACSKFYGGSHILTPRKSLQDQYFEDFSKEFLVTMKGRSSYPCTYNSSTNVDEYNRVISLIEVGKVVTPMGGDPSCAEGPCLLNHGKKADCVEMIRMPDGSVEENYPCPYHVAIDTAQKSDMIVHNLHSFIFQTYYAGRFQKRELLVVDECFPPEVEILTEKGFIQFGELPIDIKVAQYDNGNISFVNPTAYINREYSGELINLKSDKKVDILMTPGHELLIKKVNGGFYKEAVETAVLTRLKHLKTAGLSIESSEDTLSVEERFLIALQADGSIAYTSSDGTSCIHFSFMKERKISRFLELMNASSYDWDEVKNHGNGERRFTIKNVPRASKLLWDNFTCAISSNKAKAILEEMVEWDGSRVSDSLWYYSSVVEANVDFYQSLCAIAGFRSRKTIQVDNRSESYKAMHRLFISLDKDYIGSQSLYKVKVPYTGTVHCVRVPSGNIVVRSKGVPLVIGNCHEVEGILRGFAEKKVVLPLYIKDEDMPDEASMKLITDWVQFLTPFADKFSSRVSGSTGVSPRMEFEELLLDMEELSEHFEDKFVVEIERDFVSKRSRFKFTPEYVGNLINRYITNFGEKRLFMSGTIYSKDLYCKLSGLNPAETCFIKIGSSFPLQNRPIYMKPEYMVDTSHKLWDENFSDMISKIKTVMTIFHDVKGLIHSPSYHASLVLRNGLKDTGRVVTHDKDNFSQVLSKFYDSKGNDVLISPICQQGVDFKGDRARFQIILRVPYPNTSDKFMEKKVKEDFPYYNYQALITFGQQIGRVNRSDNDFGVTILMDDRFAKFVSRNKTILPKWLTDAIIRR